MNPWKIIITLQLIVLIAICTHYAIEYRNTKPIESELLCKQVHEVNSRTNIVLECVEKGTID